MKKKTTTAVVMNQKTHEGTSQISWLYYSSKFFNVIMNRDEEGLGEILCVNTASIQPMQDRNQQSAIKFFQQ